MSVEVSGGDKWRKVFENLVAAAGQSVVEVGVLSGAGGKDSGYEGLPTATIGFWHEFGTSRTPARSFLRRGASEFSDRWGDAATRYIKANAEGLVTAPGGVVRGALSFMGNRAASDIKRLLTSGAITPPVSAARERYKAKAKPKGRKPKKDPNSESKRKPRSKFFPRSVGHPLVFSGNLSKAIAFEVKG
jgi:hypothetical protein